MALRLAPLLTAPFCYLLQAWSTAVDCASHPGEQTSLAASSQSDSALSASWQAAGACANASQNCLHASSGMMVTHFAAADLSQTCLQDASFAALPPPLLSSPQPTTPANTANANPQMQHFRANFISSSRFRSLILRPSRKLPSNVCEISDNRGPRDRRYNDSVSWLPTLRRPVWAWSALAIFVSACAIKDRVVDEQTGSGMGGGAVLGTSSGSGGGGGSPWKVGNGGGPSKAGTGAKPDFSAPDPLFPPFKNGSDCVPGTTNVPGSAGEVGGESGEAAGVGAGAGGEAANAGGNAGIGRCARSSCASTRLTYGGKPVALVVDAGEAFFADNAKGNGYVFSTAIGAQVRLLTALDSPASGLAVDASWVYIQT